MLRFFAQDGDDRLLLVNLGRDLQLDAAPEPLLAPPRGRAGRRWSSEDPNYGGSGTGAVEREDGWHIPGDAAVVLRRSDSLEHRAGLSRFSRRSDERWRPPRTGATVVAARHRLSDLSALLPGQQRRRRRRSAAASRSGSITCAGSASTRCGSRRSIRGRWRISATTSSDYCDIHRIFGTLRRFRRRWCRGARPRAEGDPGFRAEPHAPTSTPGSWRAARLATTRSATGTSGAIPRRMAGRRTTGSPISAGSGWTFDEATRPVLLPRLSAGAARPELAQSGGRRRRCWTCCASGSSAAWTVSAST